MRLTVFSCLSVVDGLTDLPRSNVELMTTVTDDVPAYVTSDRVT